MKALYFEEPVDQFSCVERAWRKRLDVGDEPAIFLRSRPGSWSGRPRPWSIKYVLAGRCEIEAFGRWCEVYAGFCFVVPECAAYRSTIRQGTALSLFGRSLADAPPENEFAVTGMFNLTASERRALADRVRELRGLGQRTSSTQPDAGLEVSLERPFPLPRSWRRTRESIDRWLEGGAQRSRTAERLLRARHFMTAGFRDHDICSRAAEEANMTRSHFSRQYSALFGVSPRQFVIDYRSAVARSLLATGAHSVEEVAERLGYRHPSSLAHLFQRRRLGSPRSLRAALRRGDSS